MLKSLSFSVSHVFDLLMGAKHSAGPYPKGFKDNLLCNIDLKFVRGKVKQFYKVKKGRMTQYNDLFISQSEVQHILKLTPRQSYELFNLLDHEKLRRIPVFDLWGALALATSNSMGEKITFLFELIDFNRDEFISALDLQTMLICATRGLARLKNIERPPDKILREITNKAMTSKSTVLNEHNEISPPDLRVFMSSSDACRKYFSNLGTNIELQDDSKLVQQRADLLLELAEVEYQIRDTKFQLGCEIEDEKVYTQERGGDHELLRISESQLASLGKEMDSSNKDFDAERLAIEAAKRKSRRTISEDQMKRRAQRDDPEGDEQPEIEDAEAFSQTRQGKPAQLNSAGNSAVSHHAFFHRWSRLAQDEDKLVCLTIDDVEDLFEACGILLTDQDAMNCLDTIPSNQLGRHKAEDVLAWFTEYSRWNMNDIPEYREAARNFEGGIKEFTNNVKKFIEDLNQQAKVVEESARIVVESRAAKRLADRLANGGLLDDDLDDLDDDLEHQDEDSFAVPKGLGDRPASPGGLHLDLLKDQVSGAARLAAWQRQQVLRPPSRVDIKASFGMSEDEKLALNMLGAASAPPIDPLKKAAVGLSKAKGKEPSKNAKEKTKLGKKEQDEGFNEKMKFTFEAFVKPLMDNRGKGPSGPFFQKDCDEIKDVYKLSSSDLLDFFTYTESGLLGDLIKSFGTVSWVVFDLKMGTRLDEARLFEVCCKNFFESIPWDERKDYYSTVKTGLYRVSDGEGAAASAPSTSTGPGGSPTKAPQTFNPSTSASVPGTARPVYSRMSTVRSLFTESESGTASATGSLSGVEEPAVHRVLLVGLFHVTDVFRQLEETIPAGVLLSRCLRDFKFEISLAESIADLYQRCAPFEYYLDRLYGPQEDELGEEGMNPLRFAKMCRKRQAAAQKALDNADSMPMQELREHCKQRGLDDRGTKPELVQRVQMAFQRQLDIIGFGEMSAFGEEMCKKIFESFKRSRIIDDGGLSLWEMNYLLSQTNSERTIYDSKEYKRILAEQQLQVDKAGCLLPDGLTAYYEHFGRLGSDMQALGFGSLDEMLRGSLRCSVDFESEGFGSLVKLLSDHTVAEPLLKKLLIFLSTLQGITADCSYRKLSHFIEAVKSSFVSADLLGSTAWNDSIMQWFSSIQSKVTTPGWFTANLHAMLEFLANGEDGLVRSLRLFLAQKFTSFDDWEKIFRDNLRVWRHRQQDLQSHAEKGSEEGDDDSVPSSGRNETASQAGSLGSTNEFEAVLRQQASEQKAKEEADQALERIEEEKQLVLKFEAFIRQCLPELNDTRQLTEEHFLELGERVKRFSSILANEQTHLTRTEREDVKHAKDECEAEILAERQRLEECKTLCAAHACALYDAFRLYGSSISSVGWGTKEICVRATSKGCEWAHLLPRAVGEYSIPRQVREEKLRRAAQRKNAALAAMERERLRRGMDKEEKEKMVQDEHVKKVQKFEEEERDLFAEAYDGYSVALDERQSLAQLEMLASKWEHLAVLKATRYPRTMQTVVSQNNFGCVCFRFFDKKHSRIEDAVTSFEASVDTLLSLLEEMTARHLARSTSILSMASKLSVGSDSDSPSRRSAQNILVIDSGRGGEGEGKQGDEGGGGKDSMIDIVETENDKLGNGESGEDEDAESRAYLQSFPRVVAGVPESIMSPCLAILQNLVNAYKSVVPKHEEDDHPLLEQLNFSQKKRLDAAQWVISSLFEQLNDTERERIVAGVVKSVHHIPVLVFGALAEGLLSSCAEATAREEVEKVLREEKWKLELQRRRDEAAAAEARREAEELERKRLEDLQREQDMLLMDVKQTESDLAAARREREERSKRQRELDVKRRQEVSRQRNKLYAMIRTNEITKIFKAHAKSEDLDLEGAIRWGSEEQGGKGKHNPTDLFE